MFFLTFNSSYTMGTMDAEIEVLSVANPELSKIPPFKSGVGQNIALRDSRIARAPNLCLPVRSAAHFLRPLQTQVSR